MLAVTCDNATNNDAMVDELVERLPAFPGATNRVRCFAHVVNLIAKSLIRQFDVDADKEAAAQGADERELAELTEDFEAEEAETQKEDVAGGGGEQDDPDDEYNAMKELSAEERAEFEAGIRPVKLVLAKVCQISWVARYSDGCEV